MFIPRILSLPDLLKKKSFFLFGPRATGKSSLISEQFKNKSLVINLLKTDEYLRLSARPQDLEAMILAHENLEKTNKNHIVIIDEVQKIPMLLNEVHRLIEEKKIHFLLTGSSARTLRQKHVNLLAGRAWESHMFPLTYFELNNINKFNLYKYLQHGGLPSVYTSQEPLEELRAYVNTYLKEEIQAESLVRKIHAFTKFLQTAALTSGQILNFTQLASDVSLPMTSIREYYYLLEDTFIGFMLHPYSKTKKRKAISTAKFYFFDIGVRNYLSKIKDLPEQTELFGDAFEHFIAMELRAYIDYKRLDTELTFWRAKHGQEVDFILGDEIAIEVKSAKNIKDKHFKGLKTFSEENICSRHILISHDPIALKYEKLEAMHWQDFLNLLWEDKIID